MSCRHLLIILGDQLDRDSALFRGQSKAEDLIWMAEVPSESTVVWSHKARTALFFAAMRHFAVELTQSGWNLHYQRIGQHQHADLGSALLESIREFRPAKLRVVDPGEFRISQLLCHCAEQANIELEFIEDQHFIVSHKQFADWKKGRKRWIMEHFYRSARQQTGYLMDADQPVGGQWNFDKQNRSHFGRQGPGFLPEPLSFEPDPLTREALHDVEQLFPDNPGILDEFDWPVTRDQALRALQDFIDHRLADFGSFQDAMWTDEPWLYHARLSPALNLKLLNPREVIEAALDALQRNNAPINAVEGFIRQILGWREYIRHVYWDTMPALLDNNSLNASEPLPAFFWTGDTDMVCLRQVLTQTLTYGYAHHIQRLMVTGLFSLLYGVEPRQIHEWYLAVYVDAVEWVEAPNTLGMSQFSDDGKLGTKPYVASGKYIQRMSNYCDRCHYTPAKRVGNSACPFSVLYWDFLQQHRERFASHPRTALQWKNLERIDSDELARIRKQAADLRKRFRGE